MKPSVSPSPAARPHPRAGPRTKASVIVCISLSPSVLLLRIPALPVFRNPKKLGFSSVISSSSRFCCCLLATPVARRSLRLRLLLPSLCDMGKASKDKRVGILSFLITLSVQFLLPLNSPNVCRGGGPRISTIERQKKKVGGLGALSSSCKSTRSLASSKVLIIILHSLCVIVLAISFFEIFLLSLPYASWEERAYPCP